MSRTPECILREYLTHTLHFVVDSTYMVKIDDGRFSFAVTLLDDDLPNIELDGVIRIDDEDNLEAITIVP